MVTKGVISLRNDLDTKYGTYIAVQNELVAAINELRDKLANEKWGKPYDDLDEDGERDVDLTSLSANERKAEEMRQAIGEIDDRVRAFVARVLPEVKMPPSMSGFLTIDSARRQV